MREAVLTVEALEDASLGLDPGLGPFRAAGLGDVEVVTCESGRAVVRVRVEGAVDPDDVTDSPSVEWCERVAAPDGAVAYLLEYDVSGASEPVEACDADIVACDAVDVRRDGFTVEVAGSQAGIAGAVEAYEAAGATVTLESLREYGDRATPVDALTDRQREVLEVARDLGYFEVPRAASTDAVADALDLDDSTVAEHLQRAQRNLLAAVLPESVG